MLGRIVLRPSTVHPARQGTYSIVARDPDTGEFGVAVQSHWFSVGPIVPWARPGVGAIATQAAAEVTYGPYGLGLLAEGLGAREALDRLLAADEGRDGRQVAIVDSNGEVATHTGPSCVPYAGHATGNGVSCQANIMERETVWPAMLAAYESATGPLAGRLLAALEAAEAEGGDLRGRQSAAIVVVPAEGEAWRSTMCLRVEDDDTPLVELRRVMQIHAAYELAERGDEFVNQGRHEDAARMFRQAGELAPGNLELQFWAGLGLAQQGDLDAGTETVRAVLDADHRWRLLLERLTAEFAPAAPAVLDRIRQG